MLLFLTLNSQHLTTVPQLLFQKLRVRYSGLVLAIQGKRRNINKFMTYNTVIAMTPQGVLLQCLHFTSTGLNEREPITSAFPVPAVLLVVVRVSSIFILVGSSAIYG